MLKKMVTINRARFCLLSPLFIDPQREYSLVTKYGLQSQGVCVCAQSCPTLRKSMHGTTGSSVHGIPR